MTDKSIREAQILLEKTEGIFAETSGAAELTGLIDLYEDGLIDKNDSVVVEITGSRLKEFSWFVKQMHMVSTITPEFSALTSTMDFFPGCHDFTCIRLFSLHTFVEIHTVITQSSLRKVVSGSPMYFTWIPRASSDSETPYKSAQALQASRMIPAFFIFSI